MDRDRVLALVRWVVTSVLVVAMAYGMIQLSQWQWHKHVVRDAQIHRIAANREQGTVPVTRVLPATGTVGEREQWRLVEVTGRYDVAHQVVVRLRSVSDQNGFEILVPVRGAAGTAVLVDRGLLPLGDTTVRPASIPPLPQGTVTVTGYLRSPETGGTAPRDGVVRRIDPAAMRGFLGYPVLGGYLQSTGATPADSPDFVGLPPPSNDPGPYLSYSVQWVIFATIAIGGLGFLAFDELRGGRLRERLRAGAPAQVAAGGAPPRPDAAVRVTAPAAAARTTRRRPAVLAGGGRGAAELPDDFFDDLDDEDSGVGPDPAGTAPQRDDR